MLLADGGEGGKGVRKGWTAVLVGMSSSTSCRLKKCQSSPELNGREEGARAETRRGNAPSWASERAGGRAEDYRYPPADPSCTRGRCYESIVAERKRRYEVARDVGGRAGRGGTKQNSRPNETDCAIFYTIASSFASSCTSLLAPLPPPLHSRPSSLLYPTHLVWSWPLPLSLMEDSWGLLNVNARLVPPWPPCSSSGSSATAHPVPLPPLLHPRNHLPSPRKLPSPHSNTLNWWQRCKQTAPA